MPEGECLIPLTQGQFAKVDEADYAALACFKWFACWDPKTKSFYAARNVRIENDPKRRQKRLMMHNAVLKVPSGFIVDHRNHDTLDNTRLNLRAATAGQNAANMRRAATSSGVRGVYWHKRDKRWTAGIGHGKKLINLGYFKTLEEAVEARRAAVEKFHGEFACQ
jgi:hypothetical protein